MINDFLFTEHGQTDNDHVDDVKCDIVKYVSPVRLRRLNRNNYNVENRVDLLKKNKNHCDIIVDRR